MLSSLKTWWLASLKVSRVVPVSPVVPVNLVVPALPVKDAPVMDKAAPVKPLTAVNIP